ncbi:ANO7L1 [Bugula neritina]|uniref:Anoctamin n=1 Tax=Bugula neritina TaxID=10212 RepID=A0A7J7JGF9_BUGNE|nr:ANO7L1 [Bugula neritina]
MAVFQILRTTSYGKRSRGEVGVEQLIEDEVFTAAYPLHDMGIVIMFILSCILYKVLVSIHLARLNWKLAELQQFSGVVAVISGTVLNLILIIIMGCIYELMAFKLTHWAWWQGKSRTFCLADVEENFVVQRWEADYQLLPATKLFEEYLEMTLQFGFITIFVAACPLAPLFALINNWIELRLDGRKYLCDFRRPVVERAQDIGVWADILVTIAHIAVVSNAFLIAFTSDFLPQALYQYRVDPELKGFVNFTLSTSNHSGEYCRYRDFRNEDGSYSQVYWQLLCIRLAFVVCFEHFVFVVMRLIDVMVPDIPNSLATTIKREQYLGKQALVDNHTALLLAKNLEDDDEDEEIKSKSLTKNM